MKLYCTLACAAALISCNVRTDDRGESSEITEEQQKARLENVELKMESPDIIDGSEYVMFTLEIDDITVNGGEKKSRGGYESSGSNVYWNAIFYNPVSGEYHLLDASRKMLITAFHPVDRDESDEFADDSSKASQLMFYSVIVDDYNKDGKLTEHDPQYLFTSDKSGRNFRQISPANLNVNSWRAIEKADKILLFCSRDSNGDTHFTTDDQKVPLVYDLAGGGNAKEIFTADFNSKVKDLLFKKWIEKKGMN